MRKLAPAIITAAGCLWGSMGIFVRHLNAVGFDSFQICFLRSALTCILMMIILAVYDKKLLKIKFKDIWIFIGSGLFSIVFFNVCYFKAIELMSMSTAAVMMYTAPVFVMIMSALLFRERITGRKIAAILIALAGCVFVSGVIGDAASISKLGILCGIGAGVGYALYSIFSRFALNRGYSSLTITTYTFLFAAVGSLFLADFKGIGKCVESDGSVILFLLLYVVVTTIMPYILYTSGLKYIENSKASVIASIEPVMATVLGFLLFKEKPTLIAALGIVCVLAAIAMLSFDSREKKQPV